MWFIHESDPRHRGRRVEKCVEQGIKSINVFWLSDNHCGSLGLNLARDLWESANKQRNQYDYGDTLKQGLHNVPRSKEAAVFKHLIPESLTKYCFIFVKLLILPWMGARAVPGPENSQASILGACDRKTPVLLRHWTQRDACGFSAAHSEMSHLNSRSHFTPQKDELLPLCWL